jgi:hypothetical protein
MYCRSHYFFYIYLYIYVCIYLHIVRALKISFFKKKDYWKVSFTGYVQ